MEKEGVILSHTLVHIDLSQSNDSDSLYISRDLFNRWGLSEGSLIPLRLGHLIEILKVIPFDGREDDGILLPPIAQKNFSLPLSCKLRAVKMGNILRLGLLFGILTEKFTIQNDKLVNPKVSFYEELISVNKDDGVVCYLFQLGGINWDRKTIIGSMLMIDSNGKKKWVESEVPFPDIVYNHLISRDTEKSVEFKRFKRRMARYNVNMFNPSYFNKEQIHRYLVNTEAKRYLPKTQISPTLSHLTQFLDRHRAVYVKPNTGSLGKGIYRIQKKAENNYVCQYRKSRKNMTKVYSNLKQLHKKHFSLSPLNDYVLQQEIPLVKVNDSPLDLRVHLNKNKYNEWKVSAIAVKLAGKGSITTHVCSGGTVLEFNDLFQTVYGKKAERIRKKIKDASLKAAAAIESSIHGCIGELGVDIGTDRHGNVWIIEVNSRPGRDIFSHPSLHSENVRSLRYLVEYGRCLADFV